MVKYLITATSELMLETPDGDVNSADVIDYHLAILQSGRARLIDYFVDARINIVEVVPVAPEHIKWLICPKHGEQPFELTFVPDEFTCSILNCHKKFTWEEVFAERKGVPLRDKSTNVPSD